MNRITLAMIAGGALYATPVLADDPAPTDPAAGGTTEAAPDPNAGGGAGAGMSTTEGNGAAPPSWTQEMIKRPFTAMKGGIVAYGDLDIMHVDFGMASATQYQLHLGGAYGVTDKISAGLEYSFPLAGDGTDGVTGKGPLRLYGIMGLTQSDKMTIAAEADFELNFAGGVDAMTGDATTTKAIHAGLDVRYMATPKVALFTGSPMGPAVPGALGSLQVAGFGTFGTQQHLSISLESDGPITFSIPVGVAFQATPKIFAYADTVLASIALANSPYPDGMDTKSIVFIGDDNLEIPLHVGGFYSANKNLDIGVTLLDNLKHAGDLIVIALGARWTK